MNKDLILLNNNKAAQTKTQDENFLSEKRTLKDENMNKEVIINLNLNKELNSKDDSKEIEVSNESNDEMKNVNYLFIKGRQIGMIGLKNQRIDLKNLNLEDVEYTNTEKSLFLAKVCLENYRLEDAVKYIDDAIVSYTERLKPVDRDLIISCYKSYIHDQREAYNNLASIKIKEKEADTKYFQLVNEIKTNTEKSIYKTCERQLLMINKYLLIKAQSIEDKVCFLKIKADCYRYMAELSTGELLLANKQNCTNLYKECLSQSKEISNMNMYKIGAYINFSVYCYEELQNPYIALTYATYIMKNALEELKISSHNEKAEENKSSLELLQCLKDNISEWYKEIEGSNLVTNVDKSKHKFNIFKKFFEKKDN